MTVFFLFSCGGGASKPLADTDQSDQSDMSDLLDQSDQTDQPDLPDLSEVEGSDVEGSDQPDPSDETLIPDADPVLFTAGPVVKMNPNGLAPLTGVVELSTAVPTRVSLTLTGPDGARELAFSPLGTTHRHPILGLLPGESYTVRVLATDVAGTTTTHPDLFPLTAPSLPDNFPLIAATLAAPEKMAPGVTFIVVTRMQGANPGVEAFGSALVALDEKGRVVWFFKGDVPMHGLSFPDGGGIFIQFNPKLLIIDRFGDLVAGWETQQDLSDELTAVAVPNFHHAVEMMPSGDILALTNHTEQTAGYPTSETDPDAPTATTTVTYDDILEFAPDGQIVEWWPLKEMLDPSRIGFMSVKPVAQWSHANYVTYLAGDDSVVVSVRHQSCVVKFDHATGTLRWILGTHDGWSAEFLPYLLAPQGAPFDWNWYQHNPKPMPDGHFILYDNGNFHAMPYDAPTAAADSRSRAVEFAVDETNMTVSQVWEWGPTGDERIYTPLLGDVEYHPESDTVLVSFGAILKDAAGTPTNTQQNAFSAARIIEVTRTATPEVLFEVRLDDLSNSSHGWMVHRASRQPSLYPDGYLQPVKR